MRRLLILIAVLGALTRPALAGFDAASQSGAGSGSSITWAHTVGAAFPNSFLAVWIVANNSILRTVSSVTYNGVALTKLDSITGALSGSFDDSEVWYLVGPSTGSHNIVVTMSGIATSLRGEGLSYYDINQTTPIDSHAIGQSLVAANSFAQPTTVVATGTEVVGFAWAVGVPAGITAGAGTTQRVSFVGAGIGGGDSGGIVGTGAYTLNWNGTGATSWPGAASFSLLDTGIEERVNKIVGSSVFEGVLMQVPKIVGYAVIVVKPAGGLIPHSPLTHW